MKISDSGAQVQLLCSLGPHLGSGQGLSHIPRRLSQCPLAECGPDTRVIWPCGVEGGGLRVCDPLYGHKEYKTRGRGQPWSTLLP